MSALVGSSAKPHNDGRVDSNELRTIAEGSNYPSNQLEYESSCGEGGPDASGGEFRGLEEENSDYDITGSTSRGGQQMDRSMSQSSDENGRSNDNDRHHRCDRDEGSDSATSSRHRDRSLSESSDARDRSMSQSSEESGGFNDNVGDHRRDSEEGRDSAASNNKDQGPVACNNGEEEHEPSSIRWAGTLHHSRTGLRILEGSIEQLRVNTSALDDESPFYPFKNYTELVTFILVHQFQFSGASMRAVAYFQQSGWVNGQFKSNVMLSDGGVPEIYRYCTEHVPNDTTKFMAKHRVMLPLVELVEKDVKMADSDETVKVRNFPLGALLQRLLLSNNGTRKLTECKQSHTLTVEEAIANKIPRPHLTSIPMQLKGGRMRGAMNAYGSRESVFQTLPSVMTAGNKEAYIGDIVLVSLNGGQRWCKLKSLHWDEETSRIAVTVSELLSVEGCGTVTGLPKKEARRHGADLDADEGKLRLYECISRESFKEVEPECILGMAGDPEVLCPAGQPHIVGYVRFVKHKAKTGLKRIVTVTGELVHVPEDLVPEVFNMRADDNTLPEKDQPTLSISLSLDSDKFLMYGMSFSQESASGTYVTPLGLDSDEARLRCNTLPACIAPSCIPWQSDLGIQLEDVPELERGVLVNVVIDGTTHEVSIFYVLAYYFKVS